MEDAEKELLLKMHEQFSENQNDTNNRFTTIFISVLVLFGAYGLAYGIALNFISIKDWAVQPNAVFFLAIIVSFVLTFLIILLIYQGYQHRRDQLINDTIRQKFVNKNDYDIIFDGYTGMGKTIVNYLPDYIKIQALFLYFVKLTVLISLVLFSTNTNACNDSIKKTDTCICYTIIKKCPPKNPKPNPKPNPPVTFTESHFTQNFNINAQCSNVCDTTVLSQPPVESNSESNCNLSCFQWSAVAIILVCQIIIFGMLMRYHRKYENKCKEHSGSTKKNEQESKEKNESYKSQSTYTIETKTTKTQNL